MLVVCLQFGYDMLTNYGDSRPNETKGNGKGVHFTGMKNDPTSVFENQYANTRCIQMKRYEMTL